MCSCNLIFYSSALYSSRKTKYSMGGSELATMTVENWNPQKISCAFGVFEFAVLKENKEFLCKMSILTPESKEHSKKYWFNAASN